ncbi:MAG: TetR/AcrR family transcriptional regulator [Halanaerobiales bacterium]|nr:TetR/AcrR family transcriptional regulator [Halanaerobiales bacterium]
MPSETFYNLNESKKQRVLNSAINEFAEYGYTKASITRIVNEAKIAKGSFYQYFENKFDLFEYIIELVFERKMKYINKKINTNNDKFDFFEYWRMLNKAGIKFAKDNKQLAIISLSLIKNKDKNEFKKIIDKFQPVGNEMFEKLLEKALREGQIRNDIDKKYISHLLYKSSFFITEYFLEENDVDNFDEFLPLVENMMDIIGFGIKKEVD